MHSYSLLIKDVHLDVYGHVNNATYLTLLEEARWDLITQRGYGLAHIQETRIGPVILEIKLKFLKELRLRDEVIVETVFQGFKGKVGQMVQRMIRQGEVCCEAEFIFGLFDLQSRKLISPTAEWIKAQD